MFNRYLSERNLLKLTAVLQSTREAEGFRSAVMERLAAQTVQILEREKDETRRLYLAVQLANVRLMSPDAFAPYQQVLISSGLWALKESLPLADRLYNDLSTSPVARPPQKQTGSESTSAVTLDQGHFQRGVEAALKALGVGNYFEVKS
jgi:hypothetical protein